ncbi:MAG: hypothetical protein QME47_01580 [Candidatus Thermoplasmatota archaeon]|nr:hypothetical protein [Candidatus Thermoplasmatota archaeon]
MALCVAYSNILNGIAVFIGANLGGLLAQYFLWLEPLLFVFLVSRVARLAVYFVMIPTIKEVHDVQKFGVKEAKEILHWTNA